MIWQNAWALLGLLTLALPVFIHLLSRRRAVRQKFPSLRFLEATRLLPTRSPHLTDIPLLLVRLAVLLVATLALTQPLWLSASRRQSFNSSVARVFIVDTSASMTRGSNGNTSVDSALAAARLLAAKSQASLIVQTHAPSEALAGASAWLDAQRVRGELVVLSDFQVGTIDSAAIARVNAAFGVMLVRVANIAPAADSGFSTSRGRVTAVADSTSTRGEWSADTAAAHGNTSSVQVFAPAQNRELASAAERAALAVWPQRMRDTTRHIAVVFEGAAEHAAMIAAAKAPSASWMSEAIAGVRRDGVLAEAAADIEVSDTTIASPFAVVARSRAGRAVVYVAQTAVGASPSLAFFHRASISSLSAPALLAATNAASLPALRMGEREARALSDVELGKLSRAPGEIGDRANDNTSARTLAGSSGMSDARWFWLVVLLLLGVEAVMRRRADLNVAQETA